MSDHFAHSKGFSRRPTQEEAHEFSDDENEKERSEHLQCFHRLLPKVVLQAYLRAAKLCKQVVKSNRFEVFMMILVMLTAVLIGMETVQDAAYERLDEQTVGTTNQHEGCSGDCGTDDETTAEELAGSSARLKTAQDVIIFFFCIEIFVKVIAEGTAPQRYFHSGWNCFVRLRL